MLVGLTLSAELRPVLLAAFLCCTAVVDNAPQSLQIVVRNDHLCALDVCSLYRPATTNAAHLFSKDCLRATCYNRIQLCSDCARQHLMSYF